jgi:MFS family permease
MGLAEKIPSNKQIAFISTFLVANALIWYFLAARTLEETINNLTTDQSTILAIWGIHFAALISSFIGGALLVNKVARKSLFTIWTILGVVSPVALFALNLAPAAITLLVAVLFGVSTGLGMPNCMEYFKKSTPIEKRGRHGGLIMFATGIGVFASGMISFGGVEVDAATLIFWRLSGLLLLLFLAKPFREYTEKEEKTSFRSLLTQRAFILYILPWIMFSLVNYLSTPVQIRNFDESTIKILAIVGNAVLALTAVAGGHLMDRVGRKQAAITGFVLLGLSYAVLGIYPAEQISWYLFTILNGMTWGILIVIFVLSIWGDISHNAPSDKYYAIGVLPFFISKFLEIAIGKYISVNILPSALFSFIAFFLFIAVLPLVYAPETLPEKVMKDRDLKSYIENAKKKAQKESDKKHKTEKPHEKPTDEKTHKTENPSEYEDAVKLAEKYY